MLCEVKEALYEPVGLWLPDTMRPEGTGVYAHGVEVPEDFHGEVPDGFDMIGLPPRMQLSPRGWRGYIEMMPVISIK